MKLVEIIREELRHVDEELNLVRKKLSSFPSGNLLCQKDGNAYRYFLRQKEKDAGQSQYIYVPAAQRGDLEPFAAKAYYTSRLRDLLLQQKSLKKFLSAYPAAVRNSDFPYVSYTERLLANPGMLNILPPSIATTPEKIQAWMTADYQSNPYHPEQLIYQTPNGIRVRSKSELIIASFLQENNIPYRYECALVLGSRVIYPDFTIMHPVRGNILIHEHFGMMEDPNYVQATLDKLNLYFTNGYIPGVNLLVSFESRTHPLDVSLLREMLRYFLIDN